MSRRFLGRFGIWVILGSALVASTALADVFSGSFSTGASTNVTFAQVSLAKPSDTAAGNLLFANIAYNGGSPATITPPSGWTLAARTDNDTNIGVASYWKAVTVNEPSSYTFTVSPATRAMGGVTRYSGIDVSNPVIAIDGSTGRGTFATAPTISTASCSEIATSFAFDAALNNTAHFSTPTGMIEKYDVSNTPFGPSLASDDQFQSSGGSVSTKTSTFTPSAPRDWVAQQVALRPATTLGCGLVSYWKLDESSGSAADILGVNTLANYNAAVFGSGKINNAVVLESNSGQYLYKTSPSGVPGANSAGGDLTVSGWVKMNSQPSLNTSQALASLWDGNAGDFRSWGLEYTTFADGAQAVRFHVSEDGMTGAAGSVPESLETGIWHMVTAAYTAASHSVTIYVDGTAVGTSDAIGSTLFNTAGNAKLMLGAQDNGADEEVDGGLDEWGIWNRPLSATEVASLYNNGTGKQYPF